MNKVSKYLGQSKIQNSTSDLSILFQYYGKRITKEFRGTDTTKLAIESSKKSKGGRSRFLVLTEKDVKILKRDAKVTGCCLITTIILKIYGTTSIFRSLFYQMTFYRMIVIRLTLIVTSAYAGQKERLKKIYNKLLKTT